MVNNNIQIDEERFRKEFDLLSQIGATDEGGVHRPTFSNAHLEARSWIRDKALDAGLGFKVDQAGNHSLILPCSYHDRPSLIIGSHLDSVPNGGRFDGALGVFAGLEVLRRIKEEGINLPINLEVIDFTDEEGSLVSFLGSYALTGKLTDKELENPRGGRTALVDGLERAGLKESKILNAKRDLQKIAGYLELHVEQSSKLEKANKDVGLVSSIAGIVFYNITFLGKEDHAATAPMDSRRDAGIGASAFSLAARQMVIEQFPTCYVNIGNMRYEPGSFNIIPGKAKLSLEFRAPKAKVMDKLDEELLERAKQIAAQYGLGIEIDFLGERQPALMSVGMQEIIEKSANTLGLSSLTLASGPGHDAQSFAGICPVGMIFIPSKDGISHSPHEYTDWEDCVNGANLLLHSTLLFLENFYS